MSSHLVFRDRALSRRNFMSGLAVATAAAASTVALVSTAARAQAPEWGEYRDQGVGFRFELPGKFKFEIESQPNDKIVRGATLDARFDRMDVHVFAKEGRGAPPADYIYGQLRAGAPATGNLPTREEERTVSGVPARDFIREADNVNYINRLVIVDHRVIILYIIGGLKGDGGRHIHRNPSVPRILRSLALLRGPIRT